MIHAFQDPDGHDDRQDNAVTVIPLDKRLSFLSPLVILQRRISIPVASGKLWQTS